jgi:hypothetical protein
MRKPGALVPGRNEEKATVPQGRHLAQCLLRIKRNSRFPQHCFKLGLVRSLLMMLGLMLNVILNRLPICTTDAEFSLSLLPRKIQAMFAEPARGVRPSGPGRSWRRAYPKAPQSAGTNGLKYLLRQARGIGDSVRCPQNL